MLTRRARSDNMTTRYCKNQNSVSFYMRLSNKFRHNFVKVFCGSTRINPRRSTVSLAMFWTNSRSIERQMHENLTSVCFFFVVNVEEKVQAFFRAQNLKPMLNLPPTYPLLNLSICVVLSLGLLVTTITGLVWQPLPQGFSSFRHSLALIRQKDMRTW